MRINSTSSLKTGYGSWANLNETILGRHERGVSLVEKSSSPRRSSNRQIFSERQNQICTSNLSSRGEGSGGIVELSVESQGFAKNGSGYKRFGETGQEPSKKLTSRQWLLLSVLSLATLTSSFAICLFPPFFPKIENILTSNWENS